MINFFLQRLTPGHCIIPLTAVCLTINSAFAVAPPAATSIDALIDKGVEYIYGQQRDGNWETVQSPRSADSENKITGLQWTGLTAISTYALLQSGQHPDDPRIRQAITFLLKTRTTGTYALAARCLVWSSLPLRDEVRQIAQRDAHLLLENIHPSGKARGLLGYGPALQGSNDYDISTSQFGLLGLATLNLAGLDLPQQAWTISESGFLTKQHADGGWSYYDAAVPGTSVNMTGAGVASLLMAQFLLGTRDNSIAIDRGVDFLSHHFEEFPNRFPDYGLFAFSRIGASGGLKYFGTINWFARGVDFLAKTQKPDGSWAFSDELPSPSETAFSLLFLDYGSAPIMINKLRYGRTAAADSGLSSWNTHPRDAANFARLIGQDTEQRLNWQVVDLVPNETDDLHDAPILWIVGEHSLDFSREEKATLRRYVLEGGLILGNALAGSEAFQKSFMALGRELFPDYEFRALPSSHILFNYNSSRLKSSGRSEILGLSNGVRELMLLPTADLSAAIEQNMARPLHDQAALGEDIIFYATDHLRLQRKQTPTDSGSSSSVSSSASVSLFRLKYFGNWDPEPGGWQRLAATMLRDKHVNLSVKVATLGENQLSDVKDSQGGLFAHLTGTDKMTLNAAQQQELKTFVDSGGVLVIDAAGGSTAFASSAEQLLVELFPSEAEKGLKEALLPEDPLFADGAASASRISFRDYARERVGATKTQRIFAIRKGKRIVAIYSPLDISAGLIDQPIDGINGYSSRSATELMTDFLLRSMPLQPTTMNSLEVGTWTPAVVSDSFKEITWSLTPEQLQSMSGVCFTYEKGAQRLDIQWVALVVDGKEVSRDSHIGYAGLPDHENLYHLTVPEDARHGSTAMIRASTKCPIGNDSTGSVSIIQLK